MNVTIRPCEKKDIPAVLSLQEQWVAEDITYGHIASTPDQLETSLGRYFLVAKHESQIIGFILGAEQTSDGVATIPEGERYTEIVDLYIASEYRGQNAGSQLLEKLQEEARARGIERFLLYSSNKDIDTILKFYRDRGFKSWSIQMFK